MILYYQFLSRESDDDDNDIDTKGPEISFCDVQAKINDVKKYLIKNGLTSVNILYDFEVAFNKEMTNKEKKQTTLTSWIK